MAATAPIPAVAAMPTTATPVVIVRSRDQASWRWTGVSGFLFIRGVSPPDPFDSITGEAEPADAA